MRLSTLAMLIAVYVSLDVSNPMMPGALMFGVESSVEVRQPDRSRGQDDAGVIPPAPRPARLDGVARPVTPRRGPAPALRRPRPPQVSHSHPPLRSSASLSEDH
jgi:hypothetical protein